MEGSCTGNPESYREGFPPFVLFLKEHQYLMLKKFKIQKENFQSLPPGELVVSLGLRQSTFQVVPSLGGPAGEWRGGVTAGAVPSPPELVTRVQ